jgi:16S rRNA (guanine527-N7)-methyltransferase
MSVADALARLVSSDPTASARLTGELLDRVTVHDALVQRWNPVHNLTRAQGEAAARVHYADALLGCLALEPLIDGKRTLVDVGSGHGLPGLVAAALWPDREVTLLDAARKRVSFLQRVISQMRLTNVRAVHGRAQDVNERWDLAVSRATFPWPELKPVAAAVGSGGLLCAFVAVAPSADEWASQSEEWGTESSQVVDYKLPGVDHRSLLIAKRK